MAGQRIFEEVLVGNFHGQKGGERFPRRNEATMPPPRTAAWRSNLVALSQRFNLYFVAYGDEIHVTIPRDLRQTLPTTPDVILDLPRSEKAFDVPGILDRIHPHDVNNMKVGLLGDLEILLMGCDDGDVIAYYTHQIEREARTAAESTSKLAHFSEVKPFFHENVGISAWGLAIHQTSRLIAAGTNFREVVVFKPGISARYAGDGQRYFNDHDESLFMVPISSNNYLQVSSVVFTPGYDGKAHPLERLNCKVTLALGIRGHNVPSIDFLDDEKGEAYAVLAVDITGRMWSLDLSNSGALESPPIHESREDREDSDDDEMDVRGWGVIAIPVDAFKLVGTPQEALGQKIESALSIPSAFFKSKNISQCLEITSSVNDVRDVSLIHPPPEPSPFSYGNLSSTLELENSDAEDNQLSEANKIILDKKRDHVLRLLKDYRSNKHMLRKPRLPFLTENNWVKSMVRILESDNWSYDVGVQNWVTETDLLVNLQWNGARGEAKALQYLLMLPTEVRYRFQTWNEILDASLRHTIPGPLPSILPLVNQSRKVMRAQDSRTAIVRMNNYDVELLPPDPDMLSTICRSFARQRFGNRLTERLLDPYDRLNMFSVIPELSLLVVASQKGRVGLFTLTRLEESFCQKISSVLTFRLDRILPLSIHEREFRPFKQLLGIAVAPLQGRGANGEAQRKIWRLILHYMDHSVLSYELQRDDGDGLEVL
ncbi:uncharacterized protein L3040_009190 [Drepanopeziza brunnea f. sp. 'multigermtubi']|uniref:uncharacterized protein n=1 Tax=Drepanopeziza brunnea f. sp. 'multigermtubi' TaxID=698441 RepID=UPI002393A49A|nr:hypothetical protein L3040_009190 [Drepanopeziza brunnea f. sp. 'multigermtubi']